MYNVLARAQNTFSFFTSVAFAIAVLIAATDLIAPRAPSGTLKTTNVQVYVHATRVSPRPASVRLPLFL